MIIVSDILLASLMDTLTENPELVTTPKEPLDSPELYLERQRILQRILELGYAGKTSTEDVPTAYKDNGEKLAQISLHLKSNNPKHIPIGFGKYNTS